MKNYWSDDEASAIILDHESRGINEDIALRVYTSRLVGAEPELVIHGGGNTSVKTVCKDFLGHDRDVICVKGSGWDLATIEAPGLPALHLSPLGEVRGWERLSDEDMTAFLRVNLLDPKAPNPSVETLLHAFLPHKFVDHSHATAILAVSDQPNGLDLCREIFANRVAIVPYVMAGFSLAKETADAYEANPEVEGIILEKHGLFTFGESARQSYDRMIDLVTEAEKAIERAPDWAPAPRSETGSVARPGEIAPIIRGACVKAMAGDERARLVLDFRASNQIMTFVNGRDLEDYGARGVVTPDHIIRTKNNYLIAPAPEAGDLETFKQGLGDRVAAFSARYDAYFEANNQRVGGVKTKLDAAPRVVLAPGVGLFGLGTNSKAAKIAADLAEITIDTVIKAERVGRFEPLEEPDLFDMEYWSLEQAKLSKSKPAPLEGHIAVVTGGAGAIGLATAKLFAANGAAVALFDIDEDGLERAAQAIDGPVSPILCDLTDAGSVEAAFEKVRLSYGGLDILVSNAGAAWEAPIDTMDEALLRRSFEINFFAHQRAAQAAFAIFLEQGTGGALLFNVSKQAVNPGARFGAYGLPKAATLFLARQYALEGGPYGVRANAVNADRIQSGLLNEDMIKRRAEARGVDKDAYLKGNLLGKEVTAQDVAQAFLHHALALKTTGDVTTVDGGNVAAMLR